MTLRVINHEFTTTQSEWVIKLLTVSVSVCVCVHACVFGACVLEQPLFVASFQPISFNYQSDPCLLFSHILSAISCVVTLLPQKHYKSITSQSPDASDPEGMQVDGLTVGGV